MDVLNDHFFRMMGFVVLPAFLDVPECERLREYARTAPSRLAVVVDDGGEHVDEDYRKTRRVSLGGHEAFVVERLSAVRPTLRDAFGVGVEELQKPQLLAYEPGDFFAAHADREDNPGAPDFVRRRQVTVVVFLGHDGEDSPGDAGGVLQFQGLLPGDSMKGRGYPFAPAAGTLLAFPAGVVHEVTPVLRGRRYSLVAWFC